MSKESFQSLNFGTKPTSTSLESIDVTIDKDLILTDFASAYFKELVRRNPVRVDAVGITEDELSAYFTGIVTLRVECVNGVCKVWRQIKQLLIPAWIEFVITQIGEVIDVDRGLKIRPVISESYDLDAMFETSDKLRAFITDGVVLNRDAFPREQTGDYETMSMAIINDYVQSQSKDSHPIASYVAAFLGFKLQEEAAFKMLYRVRYDDVEFIKSMLLREGSLF